jgi:peptidoglycan biosynthesis protein MviN/MurJ (putative lipid II flippase)
LAGLSLSLPFCALEMVFTTFFYAHKRMVVTMVAGIISTVLAVAALPLLRDHFSLAGIAAFLFIARAIKVALLLFCFRFIQVRVPWGRAMLFLGKMLIPLSTALAFYLLASRFFFPTLPARLHSPIPSLVMGSALLAGVYALGLWAFRFPECKQTIEFLHNSLQKVLSPAKSRRDAGTENNKK